MTPEERVERYITNSDPHYVKVIADVIRTAENDALEQAAVALGDPANFDLEAEEVVRSLKHSN